MSDKVIIYTDGACSGNPGNGGWGALLISADNRREIYGGEKDTTNNKMELTAVIKALSLLKYRCDVDVWTDSQYVKNGITDWIIGWKKNGWKNSQKKPVKNKDLWMKLDELSSFHNVSWYWVKGHNGHIENERVDELARQGIAELK
ncbi:ribonuclease HI [bacterium]|nr:ribonuclease HI [bacterium]MDE6224328.1 ribonuclease HI [Alphaproteobacteria bacterium]